MNGPLGCVHLLVIVSALRCMPARRSELARFQLGPPQSPLTFQPCLQLAKVAPLFCEVASLMVLQALRKAFSVTGLLINACSFAPALRDGPDGV
jgi:hypothetical protein